MNHPYQNLEGHPLWQPIQEALGELASNQDVSITTDGHYVVGYLLSKIIRGTPVIVDWAKCASSEEFYDMVLPQCGSPSWHGRNLDALNDSWVTGGIDEGGPPFAFWFLNWPRIDSDLSRFREAVEEIAAASVATNGGEIHRAEQVMAHQPA